MKQADIFTHVAHVNRWELADYMNYMSDNFRLFYVSNLSVSKPPNLSAHVSGVDVWFELSPEAGAASDGRSAGRVGTAQNAAAVRIERLPVPSGADTPRPDT